MNRLIICTFAVVSLNSFGAAGPEIASSQEAARSDALHRLITVTQGPSNTPFCIAYRPIATEEVYACLVASPKLNESFPPDIAQILVDALPVDDMKSYNYESGANLSSFVKATRYTTFQNAVHSKILEGVVSKDILSNTLAIFFVLYTCKHDPFAETYTLGRKHVDQDLYGHISRLKGLECTDYDLNVAFNHDAFEKSSSEASSCSIS